MASIESNLFYFLLRLINKKKFLQLQFAFGKFDFYNSKEPPPETYQACKVHQRLYKGRKVFTLSPISTPSSRHVFYIHGGAYVQNFVKQHWKFLARLVERTHCTVTAADYPLAPQNTYRDAFDMMAPLYDETIRTAGADNFIVMGDSAGGGFALALAQKAKLEGLQQPRRLILLSPWLDISLTNPEIRAIDRADPFLGIPGLRKAGAAYAADAGLTHYMVSPLYGPLEGLAEISVFVGSRDILVADARKLCRQASQQGIAINYREYPDMVHVWMLLNFRESKQAQKEIFELVTRP